MARRSTTNRSFISRKIALLNKIRRCQPFYAVERQIVLRVYYSLHTEKLRKSTLHHDDNPVDASATAARLCGKAVSTVASIVAAWNKSNPEINKIGTSPVEKLFPNHPQMNRSIKNKRIQDDDAAFFAIHNFVHEKRHKRENIISLEVPPFLTRKEICSIHRTPDGIGGRSDYKAALRATQRYLRRNGFLRGKKSGSIRIDPQHVVWRNNYI